MEAVLGFIAGYINQIIMVIGVGVLSGLIICAIVFSNKQHELQDMLDGGRVRTLVNPSTLETKQERYATLTREDTDIKRQGFNRWCSVYLVLAQLISVLPLLGILGTVAGLIMEVTAGDLDAVLSSLDTALYSTLFALIFAIVLKVVDSFSTSRLIYNIEVIFDDYDRRFRDAIDLGRFNE